VRCHLLHLTLSNTCINWSGEIGMFRPVEIHESICWPYPACWN
jgi:hypothetical protein